jgi:hypothetical protein
MLMKKKFLPKGILLLLVPSKQIFLHRCSKDKGNGHFLQDFEISGAILVLL